MQVRLIKDCFGPNPAFDPSKEGDRDTNWPERSIPKGTIIDHLDAFYLCLGDSPNAEPFDEEAKQKHAKYIEWRDMVLKQRAAAEAAAKHIPPEESDEEEPSAVTPLTPIMPLPSQPEPVADPQPEPEPAA